MKARNLIILSLFFIFATATVDSFAQRGMKGNANAGECIIPDLSPEQETQMEELRTERIAASTQHRAKMEELRARKRALSIADNADLNEINEVIDQMEALRTQHLKENAAHRQEVREILTPEQRIIFDSKTANRPRFEQKNHRRGSGDGGRGQGAPRGDRRR